MLNFEINKNFSFLLLAWLCFYFLFVKLTFEVKNKQISLNKNKKNRTQHNHNHTDNQIHIIIIIIIIIIRCNILFTAKWTIAFLIKKQIITKKHTLNIKTKYDAEIYITFNLCLLLCFQFY